MIENGFKSSLSVIQLSLCSSNKLTFSWENLLKLADEIPFHTNLYCSSFERVTQEDSQNNIWMWRGLCFTLLLEAQKNETFNSALCKSTKIKPNEDAAF